MVINMEPGRINTVRYKEVKVSIVDYPSAYRIIKNTIANNQKGYVCVTDVVNTVNASKDSHFRNAVNASLLSVADGMPLVWYAKLAGYTGIDRISGMDLMVNLFCEHDGFRHYLLGDTEERLQRVMEKARNINGAIRISGHSPPFRKWNEEDTREIFTRLNEENPDIVWVCLGGGKQDKWMYDNIDRLDRGVMVGIGAAFKWFLGDLYVPPIFFQKMGLQWAFRLTQMLAGEQKDVPRVIKTFVDRIEFCLNFPSEVIKARGKRRQDEP
jgi:N-acetylglucosaminyldiphosphoundecaprenol N-acetyl-beta-D-mannosaminyltransferase